MGLWGRPPPKHTPSPSPPRRRRAPSPLLQAPDNTPHSHPPPPPDRPPPFPATITSVARLIPSASDSRQPYRLSNFDFVTESFTLIAGTSNLPCDRKSLLE